MPIVSGGGGGSGSFNGGTITQPLIIHVADQTRVPFEIRANLGTITQDLVRISNTVNDGDVVVVTKNPSLVVSESPSGATVFSAGSGLLQFGADVAAAFGFYNAAFATQQTLHSGTTTPEAIALALEATGLCGGD